MSKHHDWQNKAGLTENTYVCSKCKVELSDFDLRYQGKRKYECQPRHVEKGKFKRIHEEVKAQNHTPMTEEQFKEFEAKAKEEMKKLADRDYQFYGHPRWDDLITITSIQKDE